MEGKQEEIKPPGPAVFITVPPEADSRTPANAKRPRHHGPPHSAEVSNSLQGYTILDVLNADCWRLVLDYVSVRDVVRSERVSRAWQRVVRDYLAGVHRLVNLYNDDNFFLRRPIYANCHVIELHKHEFFKDVVEKWGPFIVSVTARLNQEKLEAITLNCPDLKSLTAKLEDDILLGAIASENLEELVVIGCRLMSGLFLLGLRSNLKTLVLEDSNCMRIKFLLLAVHRLTGLRRLELNSLTDRILQNVHLLLYKMPHLEYLSLTNFFGHERIDLSPLLPALCCLSSLRELYLDHDSCVTAEWIEAVGRGCPALRVVDIGFCLYVGGRGVVALCRARPELTWLSVVRIAVTDADLYACACICADLEFLDASWCYSVTRALTALLAWPRPRPLRLRLFGNRAEKKAQYEGIKILRDRPPHVKKRY